MSGHKILVWNAHPDKENKLTTSFEWPKDGSYIIRAGIIKSKKGGEFSLKLNNNDLMDIDFGTENEDNITETIELGKVNIEGGIQTLTVKWNGEKGEGNNLRLDYIKFYKQ